MPPPPEWKQPTGALLGGGVALELDPVWKWTNVSSRCFNHQTTIRSREPEPGPDSVPPAAGPPYEWVPLNWAYFPRRHGLPHETTAACTQLVAFPPSEVRDAHKRTVTLGKKGIKWPLIDTVMRWTHLFIRLPLLCRCMSGISVDVTFLKSEHTYGVSMPVRKSCPDHTRLTELW